MTKTITNATDACCPRCIIGRHATLADNTPVCERCGNDLLIDRHTREAFAPVYAPAKTYRASKYTPEMACRRTKNLPWAIIRERRVAI